MAEAAVAPPAAPAAAPEAPASAPPKTEGAFNNPFSDIDDLFKESEPEEPSPPPKPEPKPKAPVKPDKPDAKTPQKTETKTPADKTPVDKMPVGERNLREAYERTSKRVKELEAEVEKAKTPAEDPERKAVTERLEAAEKRRQELEDELKYAAYERSQEYKEKYQEPLRRALESSYEDVKQLPITDASGNETKATEAHLNALVRMELHQAIPQAKEWFGDAATEVLAMRRNILGLRDQAEAAVKQFRTDGLEREKQRGEATVKQIEARQKAWRQHVDEGIEKHPELFKAADDDAKGKELLTKGMALADAGFSRPKDMPESEMVRIHAAIRNKAGGFDYAVYRLRQAQNRVKDLETKLAEYEASEPGEGSGAKTPKSVPVSWEQEIEELAST